MMRSDEIFHGGTKCVAFTIANPEAEFWSGERSVVRCRANQKNYCNRRVAKRGQRPPQH